MELTKAKTEDECLPKELYRLLSRLPGKGDDDYSNKWQEKQN
jgi:hypothetical protein